MTTYHEVSRRGFFDPVTPYTPEEILSDRVQEIAEYAGWVIASSDESVAVAFPQLVLPEHLQIDGNTREQRAGYVVKDLEGTSDSSAPEPLVFFNARIVKSSEEVDIDFEGCLSVSNGARQYKVQRAKKIEVSYRDSDAVAKAAVFSGFFARMHAHEIDHILPQPKAIIARKVPHTRMYPLDEVYAIRRQEYEARQAVSRD